MKYEGDRHTPEFVNYQRATLEKHLVGLSELQDFLDDLILKDRVSTDKLQSEIEKDGENLIKHLALHTMLVGIDPNSYAGHYNIVSIVIAALNSILTRSIDNAEVILGQVKAEPPTKLPPPTIDDPFERPDGSNH